MASTQDSPLPPAYAVARLPAPLSARSNQGQAQARCLRTSARLLDGMQKEALVACGRSGLGWRLPGDEGPSLKGSDLAPSPLAYFGAGMAACYLGALQALLQERGIPFRKLQLRLDNRYAMQGSASAGTLTGTALPLTLQLVIDSPRKSSELQALLQEATATAAVAAMLNGVCINEFSLTHNGERLATERVVSTIDSVPPAPSGFDTLQPATPALEEALLGRLPECIADDSSASGLQDSQQRELLLRSNCVLRDDGLLECLVEPLQPGGHRFRLLADPAGKRAPDGLVYLAAGIAMSFLAQVKRCCAIRQWPLQDCSIVQDSCFEAGHEGRSPRMQPVVTHLFLQAGLAPEQTQQLLDISEQCCFLHAACRQPVGLELRELCRAIPIIP
jgi:organic hydroperoxide reductase OsmC/OhrA